MKQLKTLLQEVKLSYEQAYDAHKAEIKSLQEQGFEVTSTTDIPIGKRYGFSRRFSLVKNNGESREYEMSVAFEHDNYTRLNSSVNTVFRYVDGSDENTGSFKNIDSKIHKNIKAAIKYIKKYAEEKLQEHFALNLKMLYDNSIENIKYKGLFSVLYVLRGLGNNTTLKIGNEQEAVKFIEKLKKNSSFTFSDAKTMSKKIIKLK